MRSILSTERRGVVGYIESVASAIVSGQPRIGSVDVRYDYVCPSCGLIHDAVPLDRIQCRCGLEAKRIRGFAVVASSLKSQDRWDPVVGAYVRNDREFREMLKVGQERESREMNMDVKLVQVDARDDEALGELHGTGIDHRLEEKEKVAKVNHDAQVKV
jgi:hypothetical protein